MHATKRPSFTNLLIASFLILGQTLNAGVVSGRITDVGTGGYLPGANVMLEGTAFGAASDRTGEYRIANVPPGSYTLNVTYIGYEDFSAGITVSVEEVTQDFQLQATYIELGEVVVQGLRQGQIKALNIQKTAANIMNVVAREQMERFPDLNTAEVLQRVVGATITRDQGEGRYILLRGTEERLNAVSVNGERIASPSTSKRYVELDVISTNQIASIEVTKALTPDMDGDAIGGSVNIVTRSALDYDKRVIKVSGGTGYSDLMGTPLFQGDFTFADRFGANKNIGLTISGNYYNSPRGSDNIEMDWGGEEDTSGADIDWALQTLELRDYIVRRDRFGVSSSLDYRLSEDHQVYVRGMFNRRNDWELRRRLRVRPEKGDYLNATGTSIAEAALERNLKDRLEEQQILSIAGGGQHRFGLLDLDYTLSYSFASEDKPDQTDPDFELDEDADLTLDLSDPDLPKYTITNLESGYEHDAANWVFDGLAYEEKRTEGKDLMGSLNLKYPFVFGSFTGEAKVGGKYHMTSKERNNFIWEYGWEGDDVFLTQFLADDEDENFLDGEYRVGPSADTDTQRDFFAANRDVLLEGEKDWEGSLGDSYEAAENIIAYYGMTTLNLNKLMILAGFRHEITNIDYTGNVVEYDADGDYEKTTDHT